MHSGNAGDRRAAITGTSPEGQVGSQMDFSRTSVLWAATIVGFLAGVGGTGLGGLVSTAFRCVSPRVYSVILGFSAGVMLAVVGFDLMPEAIETGGVSNAIIGIVAGVILISMLDRLPHTHFLATDRESSRFVKAGVIVGLGIAMHNLPEGLAIGAGYYSDRALGLGLGLIIAVHNFPEGMAMACPMILGGMRPRRVIAATAIAGLPMGFGAMLGVLLGAMSPGWLSICLGFAAGAMLFVTCDELIPDAQELAQSHSGTYGIVAGVVAGIVFTSLFHH